MQEQGHTSKITKGAFNLFETDIIHNAKVSFGTFESLPEWLEPMVQHISEPVKLEGKSKKRQQLKHN